MPDRFLVVLITAPSREAAEQMAATLVQERLAACVNVVPGVRSIYRWEGKLQHDDEILMLVKAASDAFPRLEARVQELHPYDVPEVVALSPEKMSSGYRKFLEENTDP